MWRKLLAKSRRQNSGRQAAASAEVLELRTLPAGTVTAAITGAGDSETLTITGDNAANKVVLAVRPTGTFLKADDKKTIIKFNDQTSAPGGELLLRNSTTLPANLSIDMNKGSDSFELAVGDHFDDISKTDGSLSLYINPASVAATIASKVSVLMGAGNDSFDIALGPSATLSIGGTVSVDLGAGNNLMAMGATGGIAKTLRSQDKYEMFDSTQPLSIGSDTSIQGGKGADLLVINCLNCDGNVTLNTGAGTNITELSNAHMSGQWNYVGSKSGEIVVARNVTVDQSITMNTGAGTDVVVWQDILFGKDSSIDLGDGSDLLVWYDTAQPKISSGIMNLSGGAGKDGEASISHTPIQASGFEIQVFWQDAADYVFKSLGKHLGKYLHN